VEIAKSVADRPGWEGGGRISRAMTCEVGAIDEARLLDDDSPTLIPATR
jgi:hypothetical protein